LGAEQPVYWLPVSTRAKNPSSYIKDLADLYVDEILAIQPEGPYFLGGECFGSLPALEIAQQLQEQGHKVALLVLMEQPVPDPDPIYQLLQRPTYRLTHHWNNLWRLGSLEKLAYVLRLTRRVTDGIISKFMKKENSSDINNDYRTEVLETFGHARTNYILQHYSGRTVLFFARDGGVRSFLFPKGGWGKIFTGELEVHVIPGDHMSFLEEPNVWVLAEKLKACIERDLNNE
jgi:aspartate racemase